MENKDFRKVGLKAAEKASKVLLSYFINKNRIKQKSNKSLVSEADLKANDVIIKEIKKKFPGHNILSEESSYENNNSDYTWVIDPLDGTHNFLRGLPIFGTSIALKHKDEIILGVLEFPVLKIRAVAEKGKGAFVNGKKIKVSKKSEMHRSFILFEFSSTHRDEKINFLRKVSNHSIDLRNFGSAIYHLLLIASGKSDGFVILYTNEWDVAAGFILVEEAGGKITDPKGKKWNFKNKKYAVSNGKLHNTILKLFKK